MPEYILDSNVFIEGRKGPYGFDIAPRFWAIMDELIATGRLECPPQVYDELIDAQDELADWARQRRASRLFVQPGIEAQNIFGVIGQHVVARYPNNQARRRFLGRADPWVIAHAAAVGATVVSMEQRVPAGSQQVRVPNVCDDLPQPVRCVNTYGMLRELRAAWT